MKRGLITCNGKTPDATMASALYTDLKRRDINSLFIRPHEGLFGLREWTSEENGHFEVHAASWCCWKLKSQGKDSPVCEIDRRDQLGRHDWA